MIQYNSTSFTVPILPRVSLIFWSFSENVGIAESSRKQKELKTLSQRFLEENYFRKNISLFSQLHGSVVKTTNHCCWSNNKQTAGIRIYFVILTKLIEKSEDNIDNNTYCLKLCNSWKHWFPSFDKKQKDFLKEWLKEASWIIWEINTPLICYSAPNHFFFPVAKPIYTHNGL